MRLLTVDIGNTNTAYGLFEGRRLVKQWRHPTADLRRKLATAAPGTRGSGRAIVASVVPEATLSFVRWHTRVWGCAPCVVGTTIAVPIVNRCRLPDQVGHDRLVNAYAARVLFGAPAVIIDFGTATTIDVVSRTGDYLGGMIFPGLAMSLQALHAHTALLPRVTLAPPKTLIGRDTRESVLSGVVRGTASLIESTTRRLRRTLGRRVKIIGTGGDVKFMSRYCNVFDVLDDALTLKGLQLTFEGARGKT